MSSLVFAETRAGALRSSTLAAISLARQLGADVAGLVLGPGVAEAAAELARFVGSVTVVDDVRLKDYLAETYAPVVARVARERGAEAVVATATATGKDLMPRVAALLDCGMASDVSAVVGPQRFRRPIAAGNVVAEVEVTTPVRVVTARQTEFAAPAPLASPGSLLAAMAGEVSAAGAAFVELREAKSERPDLNEARVVVAGGRGMRSAENFRPLEELCDLLGAALGASRAACDAGFVPNDLQIGQTGKVVAPDLYIGVAISGAIQHLAGMKGSRVIVAINKDAEAPIFQVADYGLVATWEQALPELLDEVRKLKAARAGT
jgi:electron transfer flavoprotein alpha subunit